MDGSDRIIEIQRRQILFAGGEIVQDPIKRFYDLAFFVVFFAVAALLIVAFFRTFKIVWPVQKN